MRNALYTTLLLKPVHTHSGCKQPFGDPEEPTTTWECGNSIQMYRKPMRMLTLRESSFSWSILLRALKSQKLLNLIKEPL